MKIRTIATNRLRTLNRRVGRQLDRYSRGHGNRATLDRLNHAENVITAELDRRRATVK